MSHFEQIVKECEDIKSEINKFAESKKISPKDVDFELLDYFTFVKVKKEDPFVEATPETMNRLKDEDFILDPNLSIKQRYTIKLIPKGYVRRDFEVKLLGDEDNFKVVAKIKLINARKNELLIHALYNEIRRKKAYFGIVIGIFEGDIKEVIKGMLDEPGNLFEIDVCRSYIAKRSVDADFSYKVRGGEGISEGAIVALKQGELVATFIKKQKGTAGRNCKGEFITPREPEGSDSSPMAAGGGIESKEDESKIDFFAQKNGYVIIQNGSFSVDDTLSIESLNLAQTGSILAGIDSGTTLKIGASMDLDAIGDGIIVEVERLEVVGNVGKAAKIRAKSVKIEGLTHGSSMIECEEANIRTHKGYVKAKQITVQNLEGGTIEAENAIVSKLAGGTVRAKNIKAYEIYSNVNLNASKLIEIDSIRGEDNKVSIDASAYFEDREEIKNLILEKETISGILQSNIKKLKGSSSFIKQTLKMAKELQKEILHIKEKGGSIPKVLKEKMLKYNALLKETKQLNSDVKKDSDRLKDIERILHTYDNSIHDAIIINRGTWIGYNEVRFIPVSQKALFMVPREQDRVIKLFEDIDGKKSIKGSLG